MSAGGVRGDLGALGRLRDALANVRSVAARTAQLSAAPLTAQMQADFSARRSPDGSGWPGSYSLVKSGALRGKLLMQQSGNRLRISGLPSYARYQKPRQFVPGSGSRLPASYRAIVDAMSARALKLVWAEGVGK